MGRYRGGYATPLLTELGSAHRILDLGCGAGSFEYRAYGPAVVIGVDTSAADLARGSQLAAVGADSLHLPFPRDTFDLVVCHHSLEHFHDAPGVLGEIRRVLRSTGKLFISVPEGASFSDRLYRLLLAGGGHYQRFTFPGLVSLVESATSLRLASWRHLTTSFIYVDRRNFLAAPRGRLPGLLPRRMRWLGHFPAILFDAARLGLNLGARLADRCLHSRLSRYGWALAFDAGAGAAVQERGAWNVCMNCGHGSSLEELAPLHRLFYRCHACRAVNPLFRWQPRTE